jgi:hypothetical protein
MWAMGQIEVFKLGIGQDLVLLLHRQQILSCIRAIDQHSKSSRNHNNINKVTNSTANSNSVSSSFGIPPSTHLPESYIATCNQ